MSLKAIITTLVLGSSSVALAAPSAPVPTLQPALWMRHVVETPKPILLASSARINGRDIIKVNDLRPFTKLELRAKLGRTNVDKIVITFANGQTQTINCNRALHANQSFSIDLAGNQRNLKKIVLVGKSGRRASVDVLAI
ncbi:MAG TPA: hypothetical protein VMZ53_11160 [Kofleriaceae bacterium]|nr:hypothetical protein [Kofleriaceae bacterium]